MKYLYFCVINTSLAIIISDVSKQDVFKKEKRKKSSLF